MSKSVLVIDTPESCRSCYLREFTLDSQYCKVERKRIKDTNIKPDWCPLKPLPEKMIIPRGVRNTDDLEYAAGYNTCINEVTGGMK
nr:MAG TPA: Hairy Orange [Caudoviricetes sp.]DAG63224.1 MAG TPA: Hairy Orange [Caudoviricetes sp.]